MKTRIKTCCRQVAGLLAFAAMTITASAATAASPDHPEWVAALKAEPGAWEFFSATSPPYQRIRASYVDAGRETPGEFEKRLANLVAKSAAGKRFGYGIESYY